LQFVGSNRFSGESAKAVTTNFKDQLNDALRSGSLHFMTSPLPSAFDLMQMHVHALYLHDHASHIISVNDWHGGPVPRFFLGRTNQGNLWRFRHDLPEEICLELENLCHSEPFTISDRPFHEAAYHSILASHSPITRIWLGPAYSFADQQFSI
jgi:hypothetical protein